MSTMDVRVRMGDAIDPFQLANGFEAVIGYECQERRNHPFSQSIVLLLFLQKQNLATAIYLFGLGTLLTGLGLKHELSGFPKKPFSPLMSTGVQFLAQRC